MPELDDPKFVMGGTYKPPIFERIRSLLPDRTPPEVRAAQRAAADILFPVSLDDVSVWQGAIDFNVMRTKAQCVYIRAGYGNDGYDGTAEGNAAGAKAAGMPWGLYWFVKVGKDFKKHVASFQNVYQEYGGALPPVWDVEYTEYASKEETTNWLTKLIKNWIEITKIEPMIYTRAGWWNSNTFRTDWPKYLALWIAQYNSTITEPSPLPYDWSAVNNPRTWSLWQWSADGNLQGHEHGVSSASIDRNRFNGSIAEFNTRYKTSITELSDTPDIPPVGKGIKPLYRAKVRANALNVRGGPGLYTDYGELMINSVVPIIEEQGDWVRIDGWINKRYISKV